LQGLILARQDWDEAWLQTSLAEEHNLASADVAKILCVNHRSKLTSSRRDAELNAEGGSLLTHLTDGMTQDAYVWIDPGKKVAGYLQNIPRTSNRRACRARSISS
jgi:phage terminase Nu1 subunit (DNA packaging protein)